jgi:hypothetical protein
MAERSARELLLMELRIALYRAKSAQAEIEYLGSVLKQSILTEEEIVEALDNWVGWSGFLSPAIMMKIRDALGIKGPGDTLKALENDAESAR